MREKKLVTLKPASPKGLSLEWESIIEAMEDGVLIQGLDSAILHANSSLATMLGRKKENIIGHHCSDVFGCAGPGGSLPVFCSRLKSQETGKSSCEELSGSKPGQRLRARVSPLRDNEGKLVAFIMVVRDITEVLQKERELSQAKQLSVIGELAAGLAHEIKNPLAGIQGAIDILIRQRENNNPDRTILEGVRREVGRINQTVHALLDCARPRQLNTSPVPLTEVVRHAMMLARDQIAGSADKRDKIIINFDPVWEPIVLSIDSQQIEDAVLNLILNGIESINGEGTVTVRIYCQLSSGDSKDEAIVEVEDTGRGIPNEDLVRIFSPFCTTKRGGTGLGLPAVKRIARAHGGRVEVKSTVGKGSTFLLKLPMINSPLA